MKDNKPWITILLLLGVVPVFLAAQNVFTAAYPGSQQKLKQISRLGKQIEPIEFIELESDLNKREFGQSFVIEGDWLNNFSIKYKNTTDKEIVSVYLRLFFPETKETGNMMMYTIVYGIGIPDARKGFRGEVAEPNEEFKIQIDDEEFLRLKKFIETRHLLSSLNKVEIDIGFILFEDGTGWDGQYVVPDKNDPRKYVKKSEDNK